MAQYRKGQGKLFRKLKNGKPVGSYFFKYAGREVNTKTRDKTEAERQRTLYVGRAAEGLMFVPSPSVGLLLDMVIDDYESEKRKSVDSLRSRVEMYLRPRLGRIDARAITSKQIENYREDRERAGAKPATINRELETLRRGFNLAKRHTPPLVSHVPHFPMLHEANIRTARITHKQYKALIGVLRSPEREAAIIAYHTGWRLGVILGLTWDRVDWSDMLIRPPANQSKLKRVGTCTIYGDMQEALRECLKVESDWVIHRIDGARVAEIKYAWRKAREAVGLPWLRFHDLRACAVSNLIDAGVSPYDAMQISGHKTDSMLRRYDIVSAKRLKEIGQRVHDFLKGAEEPETSDGAHLGRTRGDNGVN